MFGVIPLNSPSSTGWLPQLAFWGILSAINPTLRLLDKSRQPAEGKGVRFAKDMGMSLGTTGAFLGTSAILQRTFSLSPFVASLASLVTVTGSMLGIGYAYKTWKQKSASNQPQPRLMLMSPSEPAFDLPYQSTRSPYFSNQSMSAYPSAVGARPIAPMSLTATF